MSGVRWGVIGVGDVVEHKSGPALQTVPGSSIAAVMRRDGARAEDFARRHGVPRWYDDAQALVEVGGVDAVYVATPPSSHAEHTIRAAAAGKPVYVEKPMARSVGECEAMIEACDRAGVGLFVAYYRRALPRFVAAQRVIQEGRLGRVERVEVTLLRESAGGGWRLDPELAGGGLFVDLASHTLDWLDLVFGAVTVLGSEVDGGPAESRVNVAFSFGSGVTGHGRWDFEAGRVHDAIEIVGSEGSIRMSCFGAEPAVLTTARGPVALPAGQPSVVQQPLIENVVASLLGQAEPLSTGATAIRTTRVIDTVLAGHRERHGIRFG
ncbi:Gfo/Idh/MocA family protein [Pseudactinotalea sp.]|uniref:Gfo/Idh/MocA family protein n=1 Tax=Pseudactinotalea sp. TaxID=1926260 RepID=UPI003B3B2C59